MISLPVIQLPFGVVLFTYYLRVHYVPFSKKTSKVSQRMEVGCFYDPKEDAFKNIDYFENTLFW